MLIQKVSVKAVLTDACQSGRHMGVDFRLKFQLKLGLWRREEEEEGERLGDSDTTLLLEQKTIELTCHFYYCLIL